MNPLIMRPKMIEKHYLFHSSLFIVSFLEIQSSQFSVSYHIAYFEGCLEVFWTFINSKILQLSIQMPELSLLDRIKELPTQLTKLLNLQKIDNHESLAFLYKNYRVHPSQVVSWTLLISTSIVLLLDGLNIVASLVCFLFPVTECLKELALKQDKKQLNFVRINDSDMNSGFTDEQFSQIVSSNKRRHSTTQIYVVYFICYAILEVITPFMSWLFGAFSWLVIRCFFTIGMLHKNIGGTARLIDLLKAQPSQLNMPEWRKTQSF